MTVKKEWRKGMDLTVVKGGITRLTISLRRPYNPPKAVSGLGLHVIAKADPLIEEFCKTTIGDGGKTTPVELINKGWIPADPNKPFLVYNQPARVQLSTPNLTLDMTPVGSPLWSNGIVNLSFLRLVGISEGNGVEFYLKGVYSKELILDIKEKLALGVKLLYSEYLKPVDMSIVLSTQEI